MKISLILFVLILFGTMDIEKSFSDSLQINEDCKKTNNTKNLHCVEDFRTQSMKVFRVVDSSIGIFKDPNTKLTIVDLGTFYGIGGNGTIPDTIEVYRDNVLWKSTTKETGIAPSTSHSEWQIPQTFFFNELPGRYKLVLITNNTETLVFEFIVKQITEEFKENSLEIDTKDYSMEKNDVYVINSKMAPLKQHTNGVLPENILCKEGLELIFKSTNGFPACVQPESKLKLIERGWTIN